MTKEESDNIIKEVKSHYEKITEYSQKARVDSFLSYYDDSPDFLSFASDGKMSNYEEFKRACNEYYHSIREQRIITIHEKFHVIDARLVIAGWTGNIIALLKNGDTLKMNNYSITSVFRKTDGKWKVIHDHESALPPEVCRENVTNIK
ncbi:MAG: nuclear transport factor 2 family protein [Acidobacteria bacterium]|jgi:ketosteroid isomerase-like protein|nr:nuclear transport factor 2 family protein [Acidobacteriota bacterium]